MTDQLENSRVDMTVSGLKGAVSIIPFAGGLVAELVGQIIPGQRLDRVTDFLREVDKRLRALELNKETVESKEFVDLFEDATIQAMRALSRERTERLATFISNAAVGSTEFHAADKHLIQILSELTDADIEVLKAIDDGFNAVQRVREKYYAHPIAIGHYQALPEEQKNAYDAKMLAWELAFNVLERLGLLEVRYVRSRERNGPEFDKSTGKPRVSGHHVSRLGYLLLGRIGAHKARVLAEHGSSNASADSAQ